MVKPLALFIMLTLPPCTSGKVAQSSTQNRQDRYSLWDSAGSGEPAHAQVFSIFHPKFLATPPSLQPTDPLDPFLLLKELLDPEVEVFAHSGFRGGIFKRALPVTVGTSISAPKAASSKVTGTLHTMLFPCRERVGAVGLAPPEKDRPQDHQTQLRLPYPVLVRGNRSSSRQEFSLSSCLPFE